MRSHLPPAQIANGQVIVAELDGEIAGFAAVGRTASSTACSSSRTCGGAGIGAALVEAAVARGAASAAWR